ncbi:MAG: anaerobic ribonucleoside-triphosphate reductase activating protein [Planctomycetes bacterium]|nr:anaerobic ribonucleoside-triphosphate reductase activating protein [Planctomycetota bacterium]
MIRPEDVPSSSGSEGLPPIRGFLPSTLIDWPGRIAAIVFLPYCNFRCGYCHSGALLMADTNEEIPFEQVRDYLESKRKWLDGVVICGGEPTLHAELDELCRRLKALGYAIKLDTNGSQPEVIKRLIEARLIDAVSMDVKTALDHRMVELARAEVDLDAIERSIDLLQQSSLEVEFRTTCCPAFVDEETVEWIARRLGPEAAYVLQRFEPQHCLEAVFRAMQPYAAPQMEHLLEVARRHCPKARLRNG